MTYTDFVSTLNHRVRKFGMPAMVHEADLWFTPDTFTDEQLAYAVGLLEYCCEEAGCEFPEEYTKWKDFKLPTMFYPRHVEIMRKVVGDGYVSNYEKSCLDIFKRHNVCVREVGNAF